MKIIKTFILIYDNFVQFEVVLVNYLMKTKGDIITVGINQDKVSSFEGFITLPHITIDQIDTDEVDLFVIPGGYPEKIENDKLYKLLKKLNDKNVIIGSICSASIHLAKSGILEEKIYTTTLPVDEFKEFKKDNYTDKNVVIDKNIITAKASGYVDFAIELGKIMNIYKDKEDLKETINYFKYFNEK